MDLLNLKDSERELLVKWLPEFLWFVRQAEDNVDQARSFYDLVKLLGEGYDEPLEEVHDVLIKLLVALGRLMDAYGLEEYKP